MTGSEILQSFRENPFELKSLIRLIRSRDSNTKVIDRFFIYVREWKFTTSIGDEISIRKHELSNLDNLKFLFPWITETNSNNIYVVYVLKGRDWKLEILWKRNPPTKGGLIGREVIAEMNIANEEGFSKDWTLLKLSE